MAAWRAIAAATLALALSGCVGLSATQRAHDNQHQDTVLFDLALDYAGAKRIAVARADQCSDAAYAAVVERQIAYNQANFSLSVGAAGQTPVFGVTLRA